MSKYHSFPDDAVQDALNTVTIDDLNANNPTDNGKQLTVAGCISVTINNGKACLHLPLDFGKVCISVPSRYDGQKARACIHICKHWHLPTGVRVTISIDGITIVKKVYGKC